MQISYWTFTNREISIFIWMFILLVILLAKKKFRGLILKIFQIFFSKYILLLFFALIIYVFALIYFFYQIDYWDILFLKETILWFFGVAFSMTINSTKMTEPGYFKTIFKHLIGWTIFIEFLVNFYSFNLMLEIIIVPVVTAATILKFYTELPSYKDDEVNKFTSNILSIVGFSLFGIIIYKTITQYNNLFTIENLKEFLFSPVMTVLILPFIYFTALYFKYDEMFRMINFAFKDHQRIKILKRKILRNVNFNLKRLSIVRKQIFRLNKYNEHELKTVLEKYFKN